MPNYRHSVSAASSSAKSNDVDALDKNYHSLILRISKRAIDIFVSIVFFVLLGWLYVVLWIGVIVTSGSPAMYSQLRFGKNGKVFKFYKFRSMIPDADIVLAKHLSADSTAMAQWKKFQKLENDPRITKFGAFIRKTSLDELPQFWNVLKGDMSIIGPRPCMTNQKELYGAYWKYYCAVRPGITGLWQVSGRNRLSYESRVALDVQYVKELSVFADIAILFKTFFVVATGHGSR